MKLQTYIRQKLPMAVLSFALKAAVAHVWYNIIYEVLLALVLPPMRERVLVSVLDLLLQLLLVQLKEAVARVPYGIISRLLGNWVHAPLNEPLELVLLPTRGNTGGNTGGGSSGGDGFFSVAALLLLLSMAFVHTLAVLRRRLASSGYAAGLSPALSGARAPPLKTQQLDVNDADGSEPFQVFGSGRSGGGPRRCRRR
jgi:hypothetical protein